MTETPPPLPTKRRIKRFAPVQLGKMLAVLYGAMGLLFAPFFLIMVIFTPQVAQQQGLNFKPFMIGFAVLFPFFYAVMGFVFGVIGAWIYNCVAKWIGGIEVEVE